MTRHGRLELGRIPRLVFIAIVSASLAGTALAAGAKTTPTPTPTETDPPELVARQQFNDGLAARDRAWKLEDRLTAMTADDPKAEKTRAKIRTSYESAVAAYRAAIEIDPKMHQAYGSLGYALRKLGDYEGALTAYDRALALEPEYVEALEYRAEAYLGLGRIQLAKDAWEQLKKLDRGRADELLSAMQSWIGHQRAGTGGADQRAVDELSRWVAERATPGGHSAVPGSRKHATW